MPEIKVIVQRTLKGLPFLMLMIAVVAAVVLWLIGVFMAIDVLSKVDSFWSFYNDPEFLNKSLVAQIWIICAMVTSAAGIIVAFLSAAYSLGKDYENREKGN